MLKIFLWIALLGSSFLLLFLSFSSSRIISLRTPIHEAKARGRLYPTPTVTPTPSPTLTPTPIPFKKLTSSTPTVTPLPILSPSPTPTPTALSSISSLTQSMLLQVNDYRQSLGLSKVASDSYTCSFAKTRATEIISSFNHDGFRTRLENNTLPYPSYSEVTENIAMNSDSSQVVKAWIDSAGHAENMRKDTPFVCIENSGNYYVYVGWRP